MSKSTPNKQTKSVQVRHHGNTRRGKFANALPVAVYPSKPDKNEPKQDGQETD